VKPREANCSGKQRVKRVLVISPHPDDESIGCGGTLRDHVVHGSAVHAVFLTSGERGGHGRSMKETTRVREQEAKRAAEVLGIAEIEFWREPDGAVRVTRRLVDRLCRKLKELSPHVIYVPHEREIHPDHQAACRLVRRALSAVNSAVIKPAVMQFEVWTPIQQIDHVVDISPHIDLKMSAIRAYKSQCAVLRFDEAVLGLSRYRGEMHSWPGGDYAEIFSILRLIVGRRPVVR
jgi:N-acetylglucosamine malate deacetylase 1